MLDHYLEQNNLLGERPVQGLAAIGRPSRPRMVFLAFLVCGAALYAIIWASGQR